jgi:hypothetical protein
MIIDGKCISEGSVKSCNELSGKENCDNYLNFFNLISEYGCRMMGETCVEKDPPCISLDECKSENCIYNMFVIFLLFIYLYFFFFL